MKYFSLLLLLLFSTIGYAQITLPVDFESNTITYTITDFGGGQMSVENNPDMSGLNTSAKVGQMIKNIGEVYGGSFFELAVPVDFSMGKHFKMKVWSPTVGTGVLLKMENLLNGAINYEQQQFTSTSNAWEELTFNFTGANSAASYQRIVLIFALGTVGNGSADFTYYLDDIEQFNGGEQVDLPITFEEAGTVDYALVDFGGNASSIVEDPTDPNNQVGQAIKTAGAELWAGTTNGGTGLANAIPFTNDNTKMTVRVWSPDAGTPIRLKVEDVTNPTISVETQVNTTMAGMWETLEFDFSNEAPGTATINLAYTYNMVSIFFNFGTTGAMAGEKTYYWDDVQFDGGGTNLDQVDLPITFEDEATVDYALVDFGGNASSIVEDPTDPNNQVGQAVKTAGAELWAGTTNGGNGLANPIPFTNDNTTMTVRVWSPDAGTPIRLKVEDASNPTISVETETNTTMAGEWETLEFDFSNEAPGTAPINVANTYDKVSLFFNFGTTGAMAGEKTYYWDDVQFSGGGTNLDQVDLPITFEDEATVDYALVDFGGNASSIVEDPTDPNNQVGQAVKTAGAELWAGTTSGGNGLANAIPFTNDNTKMTVRVWSPDAGTPIRLKVEDASNPTISVETEVNTSAAGMWETLEFDFSNQAPGTAPINIANTYDKVSIFFNFGTTGAMAGEKTYYWDDVQFGGGGTNLDQVDLPITFEEAATVDYALVDFGGNASSIVEDPTDPNNQVGKAIKTAGAELWAGTTNGGNGLANAIPFTATATKMNVRVWSPDAGTPIRLKVEDASDPTISVETEVNTSAAGMWETLEFDFSNEVSGTTPINVANTYDKVSIFFNFGTTGAMAGEKTYYWDDVQFGGTVNVDNPNASSGGIDIYPNPATDYCTIAVSGLLNGPARLSVLDASGKLVKAITIAQQISVMDLQEFNGGMYYLKIEKDSGIYFRKLVIVR